MEHGALQAQENCSAENSCCLNLAWKCFFSLSLLVKGSNTTEQDCVLETYRAQYTQELFEMQSESSVCPMPSDGLLSYSDTWWTLIGREHPYGHLVCETIGVRKLD